MTALKKHVLPILTRPVGELSVFGTETTELKVGGVPEKHLFFLGRPGIMQVEGKNYQISKVM